LKIAVLAWGSLVWDRRELCIVDDFEPIGPILPIEFCRVSRDRRLTLVIDEAVGAHCATYAAQSTFEIFDQARENLRQREGMDHINGVGFVDLTSNSQSDRAKQRHPNAVKTIGDWTRAQGFDATIWTTLASNFQDKMGQTFSVESSLRHLEALNEPELLNALRYIRCAPPEVQTPVRTAVEQRWPLA
jgi:hypothetical protein